MHQLLSEHTTLKFEIQFKFHSHTEAPESAGSFHQSLQNLNMHASINNMTRFFATLWLQSDWVLTSEYLEAILLLFQSCLKPLFGLSSALPSTPPHMMATLTCAIRHPSIIKWRSAKIKNLEKTDDDAIGTLTGFENSKTENSWHLTKFLSNRQSWTQEWILSLPFCLPSTPPQMMCYGNSNLCHPLS